MKKITIQDEIKYLNKLNEQQEIDLYNKALSSNNQYELKYKYGKLNNDDLLNNINLLNTANITNKPIVSEINKL